MSDSHTLAMLGQKKAESLSTKEGARKGAAGGIQSIYSATHFTAFINSPSLYTKSPGSGR